MINRDELLSRYQQLARQQQILFQQVAQLENELQDLARQTDLPIAQDISPDRVGAPDTAGMGGVNRPAPVGPNTGSPTPVGMPPNVMAGGIPGAGLSGSVPASKLANPGFQPPTGQPIAAKSSDLGANLGGRLLTIAGVVVTLVGVGLLLSLAWQYGYFGPPAQLATALVISGLLIGGGLVVHSRSSDNPGGPALLATGVATAYGTIYVASSVYSWLPAIIGMAIAAILAIAALVLALKWNSQFLAVPVVAGSILLIGFTDGPALVAIGFLVSLTAVSIGLTASRPWPIQRLAETIPATLALFGEVTSYEIQRADISDAKVTAVLVALIIFACLGIGISFWIAQRISSNPPEPPKDHPLQTSLMISSILAVIMMIPLWVHMTNLESPHWISLIIGLLALIPALILSKDYAPPVSATLVISAISMSHFGLWLTDNNHHAYLAAALAVGYILLGTRGFGITAIISALFTGTLAGICIIEQSSEPSIHNLLHLVLLIII
ncbi:MAG: hypothetical protein CSA83_01310, partial [Actinomycetales bacterium]